ncbi:O-antigen ligase family protein [candidate division KSB1 bacterium]|nr:O-antigen ligase family protein [candidate division KSB1 bacterium]
MKNSIDRLSLEQVLAKWIIAAAIGLEIILIYLFAVKDIGLIGVILIFAMAVAGVIFLHPQVGIIIIVGLIYSNVASFVGGSVFKIVVVYTLVAWLINNLKYDPRFVNHRTNFYIGLFTLLAIISIIPASNKELALEAFSTYLKSAVLYFLIINLIDSPKMMRYTLWIIVLMAGVNAVYGMSSFFSNALLAGRVSALREDPNNLAIILVSAVPITMSLFKQEESLLAKLILFACGISIIVTTALTYSRGGAIALAFVVLWLLYNERKNKALIVVSIILLAVILYLFIEEFSHYQKLIRLVVKDQSFIQRLKLYRGGLKMFFANPLIGVGLGNFIVWSTRYTGLILALYAHNIFLHIAAETGIIGLFAFVLVLFHGFKASLNAYRNALKHKSFEIMNYATGLKISLAGFVVAGMFLSQHFNKALWTLIGLCVAIEKISETYKSADHE